MATTRELIDSILIEVGKPYDHSIRQILRERIFQLRALFIRRSSQKHGLDEELKMSVDIPVIKVDSNDSCYSSNCTIKRSETKVPVPVRLSRGLPFDFVGTLKGIPYSFMRYGEQNFYNLIPIRQDIRGYFINNGYIYLVNPTNEHYIRVRHVFENIDEAVSMCDSSCTTEDTDIFLPGDLVSDIVTTLIMELLNNPRYKSLEIPVNDTQFANSK